MAGLIGNPGYLSSMARAVVLLSGGLDSATVLAMARHAAHECYALTVAYGQRHEQELVAASRIAAAMGVAEHRTIAVSLRDFGGSALTSAIEVPKHEVFAGVPSDIPVTYVPARNMVLLSLGMAYAEVLDAQEVHIGVNAVDFSGYPDCRPEFISAFERAAAAGTRAGVEGRPIRIVAPLLNMSKAEIISQGLALGVDFSLTHTCYDPDERGRACGRCDACLIRATAFASLGLEDPALAGRGDA